ncbi:SusD/RagB family nutrient-binding outer membrane lipoprotein [Longitalea arenae]|uniref:SusD/RagB family nutrient-binding outer membrane lipoprotein n=1 Tax=Longitalea arenae TaxID=2812558 RepID=UPI0019688492|nr:SusD/RagB family nutrient-binding outer membrane lipoprotein [Longitalea arenae]
MKNILKYTGAVLGMIGMVSLQSCDKDFEETNTNPDATGRVIPQYVFTKAQYDGTSNMLNFLLGTMQYTTSYNDVAGFGSKYNAAQISQTYAAFNNAYPNEINELGIVIKAVKDDESKINLYAEARIWRVYCFSRLTDLYGDIPYSQAGLGYDSSVYKPAYDPQQAIYANMLAELEAAAQSLDPAKPTFGAADLIYGGATDKWKKFAYSLMLRLGMRMTKADANAARTWVTKAIAGGVITADADIAKMSYLSAGQDINKNPLALNLWNSDYIAQNGNTNTEGGKYQDVFITYLKNTNDPRLPVISVVWNNGVPDTSVALQKGMPATLTNAKPANFVSFSEPNPKTILLLNSPRLVFTAAESYFLMAEAALRGWYNGATASALYQNGIQAALRQWAIIGGSAGTIPAAAINNYVAANPLNTAGTFDDQMKQIYTQFWVSIFPDAQEVFASFRRTGYPALAPNNYAGNATGGKFFRRMLYPLTEQTLNTESYAEAISRQGENDLLTRVWWDK